MITQNSTRTQELNPTRRHAVKLAAISLIAPAWLCACGGSDDDVQEAVRKVLTSRWQSRYGDTAASLSLNVITPVQTCFASTIDSGTAALHFRAASTTKTFTSAAIMLLDQRGLLRIDDVLTANMPGRSEPYLPDTPGFAIPYKDRISIRMLLSHRAGVFDISNQNIPTNVTAPYAGERYNSWREAMDPNHSFTKDEMIGVLAEHQLSNAQPGGAFHYSDSHFQILGKIVEQVSGVSLNAFKERELLQPNGLVQSHFVTDGADQQLPAPYIDGFVLYQGQTYPMTEYNYSYDPGSGNLVTSIDNLTRWIRHLLKGEAGIDTAQVTRMCDVRADSNYGLGIMRWSVNGQLLGYGHNGGTKGYLTYAIHNPKTDVSFVIQCALLDLDHGPDLMTSLQQEGEWLGETVIECLRLLGY